MEKRNKIENEIKRTLESLDGIKRAEANPFLFTRIESRLEKPENNNAHIVRYVVIAAVILILNVISILVYRSVSVDAGNSGQTETIVQEFNSFEYNSKDIYNGYN